MVEGLEKFGISLILGTEFRFEYHLGGLEMNLQK